MKPVTSKIFFVFALLVLSVESQDDYDTCNLDKTVEENTVIQLKASKMNGAEFLGSTFPDTLEECFTTCCSDPSYPTCTVAVFNYDKEKEIQSCSLIQCDPLDQCVFSTMDNFTTVTMVRTTLTDETSTANTSEGEEHIGATEVEEVGGVSDGDYDDTTVQPHITTKPTFTTQKTATEKEETQTENEETTASESTEEGNEETTSGDESTKPSEATEKPENKEPTDAPYYTTLGFDEQTDANVANLTNFDHKLYDQTSTGALVAAMCFGILFLFAVMVLLGKRAYESYQRRHYSKMDYLINGMYN